MLLLLLSVAHASTAIVGVQDDTDSFRRAVAELGGQTRGCFVSARVCVVDFVDAAPLPALSAMPSVRYAESDAVWTVVPPVVEPEMLPMSDHEGTADCPAQWELATVQAVQAWAIADGRNAPVVAVQDAGFLTSHVEISDRISGQYDYGNRDRVAEVEWDAGVPAHGTFIGSVIAGDPDNDIGRAGIAPYAKLNLQKIADSDGALYFSYAIMALADIAEGDLGVRVLNYSIGGSSTSQGFRDAVQALGDANIVMVTAAGNCRSANCSNADNDANPFYPASYPFEHLVVVAASTPSDGFNTYSHYGRLSVDLAAPGVDICAAGVKSDEDFYTAGGTSYATPLVAGTAALMLEAHPDLTTTEVARVLRSSADDLPAWSGKVRSGGRLNSLKALQTAVPRMEQPQDVVVDEVGELSVGFGNAGAEGTVWVVLSHDGGVWLGDGDVPGWDVREVLVDERIELPDAGEVVVSDGGLIVASGPVAAHAQGALTLPIAGRAVGDSAITVRVIMESRGSNYLNAPYSAGKNDPTGFLALSLNARVDAIFDTPSDTDDVDTDDVVDDTDGVESPAAGCACASGVGASAPWTWLALLALWGRRRTAS